MASSCLIISNLVPSFPTDLRAIRSRFSRSSRSSCSDYYSAQDVPDILDVPEILHASEIRKQGRNTKTVPGHEIKLDIHESSTKLFEKLNHQQKTDLEHYLLPQMKSRLMEKVSVTPNSGNLYGEDGTHKCFTRITVRDVLDPIRPDDNGNNSNAELPLRSTTIDKYLEIICEYVNRMNGRNSANQIPICFIIDRNWYSEISDRELNTQHRWQTGATILSSHSATSLTSEEFFQVKYLFTIAKDPKILGNCHHFLIVICPESKTVEILDSLIRLKDHRYHDQTFINIFGTLHHFLGHHFIPSEWRIRTGYSKIQGPTQHCGAYALTNAMCLAFGYSLNFPCDAAHPQNIINRRWRMADELRHGQLDALDPTKDVADQPYYYQLFNARQERTLGDGWKDLTACEHIWDLLPANARQRTGNYDRFTTRSKLEKACENIDESEGPIRMKGWTELDPSLGALEFRDWMEKRDLDIMLDEYLLSDDEDDELDFGYP